MAKRKKCKGGVCSLQNLPKNPTPKQQASAIQRLITQTPPTQRRIINTQLSPLNAQSQQAPYQSLQVGQPIPQQYNQSPSLQQQVAPLQQQSQAPFAQQLQQQLPQQQYNPQGQLQGPLSGLAQGGFYSPYNQQQQQFAPQQQYAQQQQFAQQQQQFPQIQGNTGIPQGQVLHPTGKQRGSFGRGAIGTRAQTYNTPLYTEFQNNALNQMTQLGFQGLQDQGQYDQYQPEQFNFAPIGNQELERFYTQTIPSLAERFTAMGGGQRSSAFQGALGNAGRFLGNDLAAQQQGYNLQQQQMAQQQNQFQQSLGLQRQGLYANVLSNALRPQFETSYQPGKNGVLPYVAKAGANLIGKAITGGF
jgi:hypothetical protein